MNLASEGFALIGALAALVLGGIALALAVAALRARALFVAGVCASLVAAAAGAALLVNGAVLAALALVIVGGVLLLLWMLGGVLLSGSSVKAARRRLPLLPLAASVAALGLVATIAPELAATRAPVLAEPLGLPALLAALMFAAGLSVIALIGFGERGALARGRDAP